MPLTLTLAAVLPFLVSQTASKPADPPPASMSKPALEAEVVSLRAMVGAGAVNNHRPPGCSSPASRQFDFWLGSWDVSISGKPGIIAESSISLHDQGCVILEEWRPFGGASGHSINAFDGTDKRWHQTWVDASGRRTDFVGTFEKGVLRLDGGEPIPGKPNAKQRMNYEALSPDSVRQWGEALDEKTGQWQVTWDLTYHRRPGTLAR